MALGHIQRHFVTHPLSHTTSMALGDIYLRFSWQAWYRLHLVARLVAVGRRWSPVTPRHFAWQAWLLATSIFAWQARYSLQVALGVALGCRWSPLVAVGRRWSPLVAVGRRWSPLVAVVGRRWSPCRDTFRGRRGTWRHLSSFHVAGVPLGDIHLRFTWQAWHLATSTFVLCGRPGTGCTLSPLVAVGRRWSPLVAVGRHWSPLVAVGRRRRWSPLVAGDAAALCVAGVALGDTYFLFMWQACHLATSTCVSGGRCGTWRHLPSFCLAGVLQVALGRRWSPVVTPRHFAWQACNLATSISLFHWQAWHLATSTCVSCDRRGTWRHLPSFCVAGVLQVALGGALDRRWSPLVAGDAAALCVAGVASWRHLSSFHVAGVPLGDIHLRFAWQACYRLHLVARLVAVGRRWSRVTPRHVAWQAWHLARSTFVLRGRRATGCTSLRGWSPLVAVGGRWCRGTLRGKCDNLATSIFVSCCGRGTWRHPPAFHIAGVALGDIYPCFAWQACYRLHLVARLIAVGRHWSPVMPRHFAWQVWHLGDIYLRFMWQACHLATSTCVSRGRLATGCTWWRAWSPLVAAGCRWRRGTLRGMCGTWRHLFSFHAFHAAGVEEIGCQADDIGALALKKSHAACQCLAWTQFMFCAGLHFLFQQWTFLLVQSQLSVTCFDDLWCLYTASWDPSPFFFPHTIFHS